MAPLRLLGITLHRRFAWHPRLAKCYLSFWAAALSLLPDGSWLKRHLGNNLRGIAWPPLKLSPRRVELAPGVEALIVPATNSLAFRAVYERRLRHEPGVPEFLMSRMARYDTVLEIGANVGVYTLLFSKCLSSQEPAVAPRIFAFEPSPTAFAALQDHLRLNRAVNVKAFNCAVSTQAGERSFHENDRDSMKGSLDAGVARLFPGARPAPIRVPVMTGEQIAPLLAPFSRPLLKVDVMGHEPEVLTTLRGWIELERPDIVLGVWQQNLEGLNALAFLRQNYRLFKIEPHNLAARERFAEQGYCNYLAEPM